MRTCWKTRFKCVKHWAEDDKHFTQGGGGHPAEALWKLCDEDTEVQR